MCTLTRTKVQGTEIYSTCTLQGWKRFPLIQTVITGFALYMLFAPATDSGIAEKQHKGFSSQFFHCDLKTVLVITMVLLQRVLQWAVVSTNLSSKTPPTSLQTMKDKIIAIVGAGPGGLGVLKAIHDLPSDVMSHWIVNVYERRHDVGGMWYVSP